MDKHIFISVGDPSADFYAANLVADLNKISPAVQFSGMGGKLMQQAGVNLIVNSQDFAIIGIVEIFPRLIKIWQAFRTIENGFKNNRPDLLILIDFSGFNLRLAKIAKKYNIKVLYYICPQIWASRFGRIKKIKKYVDMVAVLFPFEVPIYQQAKVPVTFVGHPLLNIVKPTMAKNVAKEYFKITKNCRGAACCAQEKIIGLFPGSRKGEIKRLMPVILDAAKLIKQKHPDTQFILPLAASIAENDLAPYLQKTDLVIHLIKDKNDDYTQSISSCDEAQTQSSSGAYFFERRLYDAMHVCDAIIAKSGTTVLEIALLAIPMTIIYKTAWLNYFLIKNFIKIPFIGLCNIIAGKEIVRELLQANATAENISAEINKILDDADYRSQMIEQLTQVREKLIGATPKNIAEVVIELLCEG